MHMHIKRLSEYFDHQSNLDKMKLKEGYLDFVYLSTVERVVRFYFKIEGREFKVDVDIANTELPLFRSGESTYNTKEMLKAVKEYALAEENRLEELKEQKEKDFKELDELLEDL